MLNNLAKIREQFQKNGVFHTPPETLAKFSDKLFAYLPSEKIYEVYDPTCGVGGLYSIFGDEVKKYGQELDENFLHHCRENIVNFEWYAGDTLEDDRFAGRKFQCVIANPPFSIEWKPDNHQDDERFCKIFDKKGKPILAPKSKADYAFLMHIIDKMADDGVALVVMFPWILYRGNAEGKLREWLVKQNIIEEIFEIPSGSFVDTSIMTVGFIINKAKTTGTIKITGTRKKADGTDEMTTAVVPLGEMIEKADNLSFSNFIQDEKTPLEKPDADMMYNLTFTNFVRVMEGYKIMVEAFGENREKFYELVQRCKKFLENV